VAHFSVEKPAQFRMETNTVSLRKRGLPVLFSVRNTGIASNTLVPLGFHFQQAPIHLRAKPFGSPVRSYADILLASGYDDLDGLAGLLKAWITTILLFGANVIVADHAPTAIIAARALGVKTVAFGTGFEVPPPIYPYPGFAENAPYCDLKKSHDAAIANVKSSLAKLGHVASEIGQDIFSQTRSFLTTFRPLDHYHSRVGNATYLGSIRGTHPTRVATWPTGKGKRVFVYLHDQQSFVDMVRDAIIQLGGNAIIVCPNADSKPAYPQVTVFKELVNVIELLTSADLVISNGGAGLIAQAAEAGVPMLLIPRVSEQGLGSKRIVDTGCGMICEKPTSANLRHMIGMMMETPRYKVSADALRKDLRLGLPNAPVELVADEIERLGRST
jgi:UDP:flavonoid glycosyltransferase YjiC (YdhE family)